MRYRYHICDVFTDRRFSGNPLAVLPEATGLTGGQMQQIAREFNFSESTFVLPGRAGFTRQVRIFTPTAEVPFAGHPNIGTAFVLASIGAVEVPGTGVTVTFDEKAGPVPVHIQRRNGSIWCQLSAPQRVSLGEPLAAALVAGAVGLSADDIVTTTHAPQPASVGLPFVVAEVRSREELARARIQMDGFETLKATGAPPDLHLYVRSGDDFDIRARMFAPFDGVPEDPATGSANCALAGLLAHYHQAPTANLRWRIAQGVEMGRPSVLDAEADKQDGAVVAIRIGGDAVMISDGWIEVG